MAVHDVDVNQIGAAALDRGDRVAERGEIGRQDRRRDQHAHRLTSSEIGSPGPIWKPACGLWRMTMPAATPGYGVDPTTATRKPRFAQDLGRAIAVDADEIGHHVARAALAAVDEQRRRWPPAVFAGGVCATTTSGGKRRRADFGDAGQRQAVLREPQLRGALRFADQRGTVAARWPALSQTLTRALAPRGRSGRRDPARARGRRQSSDRAGGVSSTFSVSPRSRQSRVASFAGRLVRSGTWTSRARSAMRIEAAAKST